jgi:hypothetical protein
MTQNLYYSVPNYPEIECSIFIGIVQETRRRQRHNQPNQGMQATAYSLRFASASSRA